MDVMGFPEDQGGHQRVPRNQGGCLGLKGVKGGNWGRSRGSRGKSGVPGAHEMMRDARGDKGS